MAVYICRHFRRIASLNEASAENKLYYSGHLDDDAVEGNFEGNKVANKIIEGRNTALHDAVRAANFAVVDYLVRDGFSLVSRDSQGYTPLELSRFMLRPFERPGNNTANFPTTQHSANQDPLPDEDIDHDRTTKNSGSDVGEYTVQCHATMVNESREVERIQSEKIESRLSECSQNPDRKDSLPLGWESIPLSGGNVAFQETSVQASINPITFRKPEAGLLRDGRLIIAKRIVQDSPQTYQLNPNRFLRNAPRLDDIEEVDEEDIESASPQRSMFNSPLKPTAAMRPTSTPQDSWYFNVLTERMALAPTYFDFTFEMIKSSDKEIFDEDWYRREIQWTKSPKTLTVEDERWWYRTSANFAQSARDNLLSLRYWNLFLLFVPLCIVGNMLEWNSDLLFALNIFAIGPLIPAISYHISYALKPLMDKERRDWITTFVIVLPDTLVSWIPSKWTEVNSYMFCLTAFR